MSNQLFERHRKTFQGAVSAIGDRTYWSAYPEVPSGKIYGDTAKAVGSASVHCVCGTREPRRSGLGLTQVCGPLDDANAIRHSLIRKLWRMVVLRSATPGISARSAPGRSVAR